MLLKVVGTKKTTVIFMGDIWKPRTQWDSRYLWMPLEIGGGDLGPGRVSDAADDPVGRRMLLQLDLRAGTSDRQADQADQQ